MSEPPEAARPEPCSRGGQRARSGLAGARSWIGQFRARMAAAGHLPPTRQCPGAIRASARVRGARRPFAGSGGARPYPTLVAEPRRGRAGAWKRIDGRRDAATDGRKLHGGTRGVSDLELDEVLRRRAEQLARLPISGDTGDEVEVLACQMGDERYAIESR